MEVQAGIPLGDPFGNHLLWDENIIVSTFTSSSFHAYLSGGTFAAPIEKMGRAS